VHHMNPDVVTVDIADSVLPKTEVNNTSIS